VAGAYVQTWEEGQSELETSRTLTVSGATANNLLCGVVVVRDGGDSFTTPTGWTLIHDASAGAFGTAAYYRIASGTSADDFACVWTDNGRPQLVVQEFSGLDSTAPFEAKDEDITNISGTATTQSAGSATPLTANGLAVAFLGIKDSDEWNVGTVTIDNSYTSFDHYEETTAARAGAGMASKPYTTTAAQSPTFTTTDGGGDSYGAIAVFKEASGGASEYTIAGAVTISLAIAATLAFNSHSEIAGSSPITVTPTATFVHFAFTGLPASETFIVPAETRGFIVTLEPRTFIIT